MRGEWKNEERRARTIGEERGERRGGWLLGKLSSWTEEGEGTRKPRKKERKEGRKEK